MFFLSTSRHKEQLLHTQQLQADMPVAYTQALAASQSLLEAGGRLLEDPHSQEGRLLLLSGSQEVLEGTMKVPQL